MCSPGANYHHCCLLMAPFWVFFRSSPHACHVPHQDQLSADMYSFVAKEIDYASYFQTVSTTSLQTGPFFGWNQKISCSFTKKPLCVSGLADRSPGRVSQKVTRASSKCSAPNQSSSGWVWDQQHAHVLCFHSFHSFLPKRYWKHKNIHIGRKHSSF